MLMLINEGEHRASKVRGCLTIGEIERPVGSENYYLEPHRDRQLRIHVGIGDRSSRVGGYTNEEMAHLGQGGTLEIHYSDGLGEHTKRWGVCFEPKGEQFVGGSFTYVESEESK
jgi:hypothetical protein